MIVDNFLDAFGDAAEKLFAVENRGELAAHLVQQHQCLGLLRMGEEKTLRHGVRITQKGESTEFRKVIHGQGRSAASPHLM